MRGELTAHMDVAQVVLYAFWVFFAGLVFYLRREDRREGYPLEAEVPGHFKARNSCWIPEPKMFLRADGRQGPCPELQGGRAPDQRAEGRALAGRAAHPDGRSDARRRRPRQLRRAPRRALHRPLTATICSPRSASPRTSRSPSEGANPARLRRGRADGVAAGASATCGSTARKSIVRYFEVKLSARQARASAGPFRGRQLLSGAGSPSQP